MAYMASHKKKGDLEKNKKRKPSAEMIKLNIVYNEKSNHSRVISIERVKKFQSIIFFRL